MGGFTNALWFWVPVLIYKALAAFLRTVWKLNLWILQTFCGVPLYYCRPEYRIPGIFSGTIGVLALFDFLMLLIVQGYISEKNMPQSTLPIGMFLVTGLGGAAMLLLCRFLIRKGSI
jgi:hypothetical protein